MKHTKRILALVLAVMMLLSLAVTAFAVEGDEGDGEQVITPVAPNTAQNGPFEVKINNATGHKYVIYQIFTADLSLNDDNEEILSNIKYGADYLPNGATIETLVPEEFLNQVKTNPNIIVPTGNGTAMTTNGDVATATGLVAGYYMIIDVTEDEDMPDGESASAVIFQVVGNTTVNSKHPKTTIVKKVKDVNDTTGVESDWIDSADYDLNDTVPFKSTATFDGLSNYDNYMVVFTDTMSKGLTYDANMTVTVGQTELTAEQFTVATTTYAGDDADYAGGTVITVTIADIIPIIGDDANEATIVLNYTATLNADAKLGAPGNPNKIKVSTKPDGTGETPEDENIVFTFKVNVDKFTKVDGQEVALAGAGFTLYKEVADDSTEGAKTGAAIKADLKTANASIKANALKDDAYYIVAATVVVDANGATFGFNRVDDGTYVLVETQIPAGYNAWDAAEFDIVATHDEEAAEPELKTLTGGNLFTGEVSTGILDTNIENKPGVELPETGGMGTTIFYALGGMMVLAAVVLLVTKKRMATAE